MVETTIRPRLPIDLRVSLSTLRHGPGDPTVRTYGDRVLRATRTPDGAATVSYEHRGDRILVRAWGPGAEHAIANAPDVLGARDDLAGWEPKRFKLLYDIDRRNDGFRMVATNAVFEAIIPTVFEQKVTSYEAHEAWRRIAWTWGEEPPGPPEISRRLRLPPPADRLAREPYYRYHRFGVEKKRTDIVKALAARARRVEEANEVGRSRLEAFPGIGAWTSAKVAEAAWADADAVAVGDFHLAKIVVYAMTGKRGGDDDAMLELLEPFRPHRGRASRLLKMGVGKPPPRAPKRRLRDLRAI
jgi:3-methyladenine DNA glycosylase/8-oxoguanine DNA glycosylase